MDEFFARAPIYDLVFTSLSPRSLVRVSQTCRAGYLAVAEFKSRAFNVNRHFSQYFTDPIAFRSLQARTNTLVSGSNALQFLDRTCYPEADLDLYTHPGHSLEVARFLVQNQGYKYVPRSYQTADWKTALSDHRDLTMRRVTVLRNRVHAYPTTYIRHVWTFYKASANEEPLVVQIVEAESSPLETILGFHSTCVMNFISSDAAYSLYPLATFEGRISLCMPSARGSPDAIGKYVKRGWRIYLLPIPNDSTHSTFLVEQARWVVDKHTWVLPLDQTGVQKRPPLSPTSAPLTHDPGLFNGWKLTRYKREPQDLDEYTVEGYKADYYPLKSTLFRYNYAIPDESIQLAMRYWVEQQGRMYHETVPKEDWIWFDADIPGFIVQAK